MPRLNLLSFVAACLVGCGASEAIIFETSVEQPISQEMSPEEAYGRTVHAMISNATCANCHRQSGIGTGAHSDSNRKIAFDAAVKMRLLNTNLISDSKILKKLKDGHNCENPCEVFVEKVEQAIQEFSSLAPQNPFHLRRIESASVDVQTLSEQATTVTFELPTLKNNSCAPTIEMDLSRKDNMVSMRQPNLRIDCRHDVRVKKIEVLLDGELQSTTFQEVDKFISGPTASEGDALMGNHSSAALSLSSENRRLNLAFEILQYAE